MKLHRLLLLVSIYLLFHHSIFAQDEMEELSYFQYNYETHTLYPIIEKISDIERNQDSTTFVVTTYRERADTLVKKIIQIGDKIYRRREREAKAYLLFDFTLKPSDTFHYVDKYNDKIAIVDSVGMYQLETGEFREAIYLKEVTHVIGYYYYKTWIKGIGELQSGYSWLPMGSWIEPSVNNISVCNKEESLLWLRRDNDVPIDERCDFNSLHDKLWNSIQERSIEVAVFPNPFHNQLQIDTKEPMRFSIRTLQGQEILSGQTNKTINTAQLAKGIYLLQLETEDRIAVKKIIKR